MGLIYILKDLITPHSHGFRLEDIFMTDSDTFSLARILCTLATNRRNTIVTTTSYL